MTSGFGGEIEPLIELQRGDAGYTAPNWIENCKRYGGENNGGGIREEKRGSLDR